VALLCALCASVVSQISLGLRCPLEAPMALHHEGTKYTKDTRGDDVWSCV
jgi:Zn-finger protein